MAFTLLLDLGEQIDGCTAGCLIRIFASGKPVPEVISKQAEKLSDTLSIGRFLAGLCILRKFYFRKLLDEVDHRRGHFRLPITLVRHLQHRGEGSRPLDHAMGCS